MAEKATMTLRLLTPGGLAAEVGCDSVQLVIVDDAEGRGGGSVGILRGHVPAVMALADGPVTADLSHRPVFRGTVLRAFASVENDVVTVLAESVTVGEAEDEESIM